MILLAEYNFDGLVGPTHNYAGLSRGNLASEKHGGAVSSPKAAALQGLRKMHALAQMGIGQGVLPPHHRPSIDTLRRLGFSGSRAQVLARAANIAPHFLRLCSSASAMWTANAATVAPQSDTEDLLTHFVPANLARMFHRQLEAATTTRILSAIFSDPEEFLVHCPLPHSEVLGDEGAANHTRLFTSRDAVHLFGWGRSSEQQVLTPTRHPARQTLEASQAVARLLKIRESHLLFAQQAPQGIDAGAFHSDVLLVGNESFLMLHELALSDTRGVLEELKRRLGPEFRYCLAREKELPVADAVQAYPFNSQLITLPSAPNTDPPMRSMAIIAPLEAEQNPHSRRYLQRVLDEDNPVTQVLYQDVRQSMSNGGGPACLRLRVPLSPVQSGKLGARVLLDDTLFADLTGWVERYYPDRLAPADLADPQLSARGEEALDALSQIMQFGSIYDFQR